MMKKKYIAWILIVSILFLGRGADAMAKTSLSKPLGVLANGVDGSSGTFLGISAESGWL